MVTSVLSLAAARCCSGDRRGGQGTARQGMTRRVRRSNPRGPDVSLAGAAGAVGRSRGLHDGMGARTPLRDSPGFAPGSPARGGGKSIHLVPGCAQWPHIYVSRGVGAGGREGPRGAVGRPEGLSGGVEGWPERQRVGPQRREARHGRPVAGGRPHEPQALVEAVGGQHPVLAWRVRGRSAPGARPLDAGGHQCLAHPAPAGLGAYGQHPELALVRPARAPRTGPPGGGEGDGAQQPCPRCPAPPAAPRGRHGPPRPAGAPGRDPRRRSSAALHRGTPRPSTPRPRRVRLHVRLLTVISIAAIMRRRA